MFRTFVIAVLSAPFFFVTGAYSQENTGVIRIISAEKPDFIRTKTTEHLTVADQQWCSGENPCNCRAGSSGYCTTVKECAEIGGECVK